MERFRAIDDAVDALISPDPLRREFLGHRAAGEHALQRGEARSGGSGICQSGRLLAAIADAIRAKLNPEPGGHHRQSWAKSASCSTHRLPAWIMPARPAAVMDLSKIDFEALRQTLQGIETQEYRPRSAEGSHPRAARKTDSPEQDARGFSREVRGIDRDLTTPAAETSRSFSRNC